MFHQESRPHCCDCHHDGFRSQRVVSVLLDVFGVKLFFDGFSGHSLPQCGGSVTLPHTRQAPYPIAEFGTVERPVASTRGVLLDAPGDLIKMSTN